MAVLIGDVRMDMEHKLRALIEHVLNTHQKLAEYWILIHTKPEGDYVLSTKIVLMPYQPPRMLGTICYHINNREGSQRRLWALPKDSLAAGLIENIEPVATVMESAAGLPIIY